MPAATPMLSARAWSEARGLPRSKSRRDMWAFSYNPEELEKANFHAALRKTNLRLDTPESELRGDSGKPISSRPGRFPDDRFPRSKKVRELKNDGITLLLVTEGDHGIHAHGAARRDAASSKGDGGEQHDGAGKGQGIGCTYAEQHAAHQSRDGQRHQDSKQFASKGELRGL